MYNEGEAHIGLNIFDVIISHENTALVSEQVGEIRDEAKEC
jgi:hypothetical protein